MTINISSILRRTDILLKEGLEQKTDVYKLNGRIFRIDMFFELCDLDGVSYPFVEPWQGYDPRVAQRDHYLRLKSQ